MKTLKLYGASDDLLEQDGDFGREEYGAYKGAALKITDGEMVVHVEAIYRGSWGFVIMPQGGDGDEWPNWKMERTYGQDVAYSETLTIELPDTATVQFIEE